MAKGGGGGGGGGGHSNDLLSMYLLVDWYRPSLAQVKGIVRLLIHQQYSSPPYAHLALVCISLTVHLKFSYLTAWSRLQLQPVLSLSSLCQSLVNYFNPRRL